MTGPCSRTDEDEAKDEIDGGVGIGEGISVQEIGVVLSAGLTGGAETGEESAPCLLVEVAMLPKSACVHHTVLKDQQ